MDCLLTTLAIARYLCWQMVQPFIDVLLWAIVLAIVFLPAHRRIEARLHRPSLGAAVSTALVVVIIVLPVTLITIAVIGELRGVAQALEGHQGRGSIRRIRHRAGHALDCSICGSPAGAERGLPAPWSSR